MDGLSILLILAGSDKSNQRRTIALAKELITQVKGEKAEAKKAGKKTKGHKHAKKDPR
jgi:hypothetical protein